MRGISLIVVRGLIARALTAATLAVGGLLGALALVAAPAGALGGAIFGTLMGLVASSWARDTVAGDAASKKRAGRRAGLVVGAEVTGGWLALTGLVLLLGPASGPALLLLLVLIAFSAWWWHRRPRSGAAAPVNPWRAGRDRVLRATQRPDPTPQVRARPRFAPVGPTAPLPWPVPIPANLSTPQLCLAWQRTYFVLLDLPTDARRSEVVALRERLLDEIEHRDPVGFTRWLAPGARAGSDPGRYLAGDR